MVCEIRAILEHLEETSARSRTCWAATPAERAEARRLMQWFDRKFDNEVNGYLLHEKLEKRLLKLGAPDLYNMRQGRDALRVHLVYIEQAAAGARLAGRPAPAAWPISPPPRTSRCSTISATSRGATSGR